MPRGGKRTGSGRPPKAKAKSTKELQAIIDSVADPREMIEGIWGIAKNTGEAGAARMAAYRELMDRRHGKPPQAITGPNGGPLEIVAALGAMSEDKIEELISHLGGDAGSE